MDQDQHGTQRLKVAHVYEVRSPSHQYGVAHLNERLKLAGSNVSVTVFPDSQLGSESELVEQCVAGELEIVVAGPSFLSMWHPPLGIFDAAFAFRDLDHMLQVANSPLLNQHWEVLRQKFGVRLLDTWAYGTRHITSNRPIRNLADMSGFRLRFPSAKIWQQSGQAMGASPMAIPFADVYLALQTGTADGQENPIPVIASKSLDRVQKFLCLTGHIQSSTVVIINDRVWNRLASREQQLLRSTVLELGKEAYQGLLKDEQEILQRWRQEQHITIIDNVEIEPIRRRCLEFFSHGHPFSELYRQTTGSTAQLDSAFRPTVRANSTRPA